MMELCEKGWRVDWSRLDETGRGQSFPVLTPARINTVWCVPVCPLGVVATKEESHLFHLFFEKSYQCRGIGRKLWHVARDACLANGNSGRFTVNSSKGSRGVYESFGFVAQQEVCVGGVQFIPMVLLATTSSVVIRPDNPS